MKPIVQGILAGFIGTIPMTIFMRYVHALLPWREQYQLPPAEITGKAARGIGLDPALGAPYWDWKTYAAHFAFGSSSGAFYGVFTGSRVGSVSQSLVGGCVFGTIVWCVSYVLSLPAVGLQPPVTRKPARRNALMLGAHWIWGATLAMAVRILQTPTQTQTPKRASPRSESGSRRGSGFKLIAR